MNKLPAITLLLIFTQINAQCGGSLPFSDTITCGNNNVYTPKSFTSFDTTATKLTIVANIQITDTCTSTAPLSIFSLTISPSGTTTKKILDYQWTGDASYNTYVEDTTGSKGMTAQSSTTTSGVSGVWTTFLGTVDLRGTTAYSAVAVPGLTNWNGVYVNNLVFGNTWTFDSTTKIYICSSTTGTNAASCTVQSLDFWYDYLGTTLKTSVLWGVQPFLIGNYRFQSQSGSSVIDTVGNLGTAYFGSSTSLTVDSTNSPSWIGTEPGITFTATNQYVKIPTFTLKPTYGQSTQTVTINFWIKPSSLTNGFIFRYSPASLASNIFSISLTSAGFIKAQIGSTSKSTTAAYALSAGTWTLVTVSYVLQTVRSDRNLVLIYINGVAVVTSYDLTVGTITFTPSTDVVRIGGPTSFLGSIKELSIYTPGSLHVNSPSYCSTSTISCEKDLGKTFPPTCISCPEGTTLYNSICLSCPAGQYLSSTNDCVDCPTNCETCTSETTCQSCSSGYSLYDSECISCQTAKYSNEGTCVACPLTCASCTSGSECKTCNTGYGLYQSQCVTCPLGTYLSSSQECLDCTSGCLNCTSKAECQKCASGYILSDTTCEVQEISGEGTTQGNNPIILYASTSVGLALGICGLTGIIINCFSSPNISSSVNPVQDDASKLITAKPSDETIMGHSQIRLKDIVNKRKLKTQQATTLDFTDENSPGLL